MKKSFIVILFIIFSISIIVCTNVSKGIMNFPPSKYCNMEEVENTYDGVILQDTNTGVLYLWYKTGQTLTPLYNADGTLKNIKDFK